MKPRQKPCPSERLRLRTASRLWGQVGLVGLLFCACKIEDRGLDSVLTTDLPKPPGVATEKPKTTPPPATDPVPATPPAVDAAVAPTTTIPPAADDAGAPDAMATTPPAPPTTTTPPPAADAAVATDTTPPAPAVDTCAPRTGVEARVRLRYRGSEDFVFDNDGHLLLFQNNDVLQVQSDRDAFTIARNVGGFRGGTLQVLPDGDLLVADTFRDVLLRVDPMQRRPDRNAMEVRSPLKMAAAPGNASLVFVTSQAGFIYLVDTTSGAVKVATETEIRPAGLAVDPIRKKLYVGSTERRAIYAYNISADGQLTGRTAIAEEIAQPTALAVDPCGGLYIAGADGGVLRRRAPTGGITMVARFLGPDISALHFGSGKHGWSDKSLFALDTWNGTVSELELGR
jgi:SMP-30/Gluconolactonase/LRE-like region